MRSVVEQPHLISARSSTEAELRFKKMKDTGEIFTLGVVQGAKIEKIEEDLDLTEFEVTHQSDGPGCPVFYTVVHKKTGLRKTSPTLKHAYNKVVSDLTRRGHNIQDNDEA